jgi:hypothetical protein
MEQAVVSQFEIWKTVRFGIAIPLCSNLAGCRITSIGGAFHRARQRLERDASRSRLKDRERVMGSQFPRLFHEYYAIHETIHAILHETNGGPVDVAEIEQRVKEAHPDLGMGPATLTAAIRQAIKDTAVATVSEEQLRASYRPTDGPASEPPPR